MWRASSVCQGASGLAASRSIGRSINALPVLFVPPLWRGLSHSDFVLMAAGGLIYTVGAVIVGAQKSPETRTLDTLDGPLAERPVLDRLEARGRTVILAKSTSHSSVV